MKVQSRGQITLPASIRKRVGMEPGATIAISIYGPNEIRIRSIKPMSIEEAKAKYPLDESTIGVDFNTIREQAEAEEADRYVERMKNHSE